MPEWRAFAAAEAPVEPDIRIVLAEQLKVAPALNHIPEVEGASVRFSVPETGSWQITGGREIAVEPRPDADDIAVRLFTLGTAWGVLGYQRDWAMLHGSAVMGPKGAVLFCGWQGAGKSTFAAALAERGFPLVSDDLSRVVPGRADRPTMLFPSSTRHKLWNDAIAGLGLTEREQVQDHLQTEKYHIATERHVPLEHPVPLVGIYSLIFDEGLAIERQSGGDAAKMLLAHTVYRPRFLEAMSKLAEQAVYAARIAASVPIYKFKRPRDLTQIGAACDQMITHLNDH